MHQHKVLEETIYFWIAANNVAGSGADGTGAAADVRLAGAAADASPLLSPTPSLLTHANYPNGCYEVAVEATAANGFASGNTYAVFCTWTIDAQNPTGFIGSFSLKPIISDIREIGGVEQSATDLKDLADAGYDPVTHKVEGVKLTDVCTTNSDMVTEPPTAVQIRQEIDNNSTQLAILVALIGTLIADIWAYATRTLTTGTKDTEIDAITAIVTDTRRIVKNKLTIDEANSSLQLWDDSGDTVLYEWPLTDKDAAAIVLQGTGPANRGVPVTP